MPADRPTMKMQTACIATRRAAEYLKRIAALTGAEQADDESYWLRVGRRNFLVDDKFVRVMSPRGDSTCFSVVMGSEMSSAEKVACALLQLKSNPRLFMKWRKQPGYMFNADGKMLRDICQVARDET